MQIESGTSYFKSYLVLGTHPYTFDIDVNSGTGSGIVSIAVII
jgi:hypothetical protein